MPLETLLSERQLNVAEGDGFHDITDTLRGRGAETGDEASNRRRCQWCTKPQPRLEASHRIDHIVCVIDSFGTALSMTSGTQRRSGGATSYENPPRKKRSRSFISRHRAADRSDR